MNLDKVCPLKYTFKVIGGKWKPATLWMLKRHTVLRYGELKKLMPSISHKSLNKLLKELVEDKLVERKEYAQVPPKVEYRLTELGYSAVKLLENLYDWGIENIPKESDLDEFNY
jgi:DNA-binding HxlR family transcriptional regulator